MTTQREFPLLAQVPGIARVPAHLISLCRTSGEAVLLAIRIGNKSARQVSHDIGMEPAQMSRIISGNAHMPADVALRFAQVVGNWGWQQWVAHNCGMDLVQRAESPEERLARLEAENEHLRSSMRAAA